MEKEVEGVSDLAKLTLTDLNGILPCRTERTQSGRYIAYFLREHVNNLFESYDQGTLSVSARDFVASMARVKSRIFDTPQTTTIWRNNGKPTRDFRP